MMTVTQLLKHLKSKSSTKMQDGGNIDANFLFVSIKKKNLAYAQLLIFVVNVIF